MTSLKARAGFKPACVTTLTYMRTTVGFSTYIAEVLSDLIVSNSTTLLYVLKVVLLRIARRSKQLFTFLNFLLTRRNLLQVLLYVFKGVGLPVGFMLHLNLTCRPCQRECN